jgi:hypothetical protein
MARQSLTWTALPNGYTDDHTGIRLSVLLSPRLDTQDPTATHKKLSVFFPAWEDWPKTLSNARFDVTYNGHTVSIPATTIAGANRVDNRLGLADSAAWKALFTKDLLVKTFEYNDLSPSVMLSYDAAAMAEGIEDLYRDLARSATDRLPRVSEIIETERWRGFINAVDDLDSHSVDRDSGLRDPRRLFDALRRPGRKSAGLSNLARFVLFHTPPATPVTRHQKRNDDDRVEATWLEHKRATLPKREDIAAGLEFHQVVAAMGSYPTLLRRLGLVIDLVLAPRPFTQAAAADLVVRVSFPSGTLQVPHTTDARPVTRTRLTATHFDAVPDAAAEMKLTDGLLDLAPASFRLLQLDVDGAGLKAINFARSLFGRFDAEARVDPVTRHEDELGAPAIRTGGLMLVQRARAGTLSQRFEDNASRNTKLEAQFGSAAAPSPVLHAQDIVRGYRIDIWDSVTSRWESLCRRNARYELGDTPLVVDVLPEEEGAVRLAATKSSDPASNKDILYLHEALVSWTGWSLAARPPGRAIKPDDSVEKTADQTEAETPPGLKFTSRFTPVKGSLPRLRFGRSYWIRARAVDLAGNSLAPQTKDFAAEAPSKKAQPYLRYEPVAAPIIALLSQSGTLGRPLEGESMARVAIRSFNDTPDDNVSPTTQVAHRVAAAPSVSVRDAEQHGALDRNGRLDATLFNLLAHQKDVDPRDASAAIREQKLLLQGPLDPAPAETTFAVYESGRELTYLTDPLAVEVAVRVFDHPNIAESEIIRIPLYPIGDWPNARPFVIELYEHAFDAPSYDSSTHRLRVPLPKGIRAKLRLSMRLGPETLSLLGVFHLLSAADQNAQRLRALDGQHWMLTPWTVLEVVHAVQRPLLTPEFTMLGVHDRSPGQTSARPLFHARCSIDTTDRLDLYGEWHEPLDDPAAADSGSGPVDRHRRDAAFQIKITSPKIYADKKAGGVAGGWPEHSLIATDLVGINTTLDRRVPVKAHEFHDTRYRRIEYWLDATTRFREFLPPDLLTRNENGTRVPTEEHIKVTGARQVTWIPNAAPPPAPHVLYVVPIFGWTRDVDEHGMLSSWRRGGGLRVYLDRGWNASGYGEMVGVVLPPQGFADDPEKTPQGAPYKKYVTQWGNDPVWDSAFVPGIAPTLAHFPLARTAPDPAGAWLPPNAPAEERDQPPGSFRVKGLPPTGLGARGGPVDVAPHDVFYDADRQLWYCDIQISAGAAYFPFIRLALARYQPVSSPRAHLSNVVLSDIVALTADRWLNVTPAQNDRRVRVAVFGVSYDESSGHHEASAAQPTTRVNPVTGQINIVSPARVAERTVVEVWLERLDERWGEDFGWTRVSGALITQRVPSPAAATTPATIESIFGRPIAQSAMRETTTLLSSSDQARLSPAQIIDKIKVWQAQWEGDVTLPSFDGARHRLVIAEFEEYIVDDDRPYDRTPTRKGRRLVFVEHVELS